MKPASLLLPALLMLAITGCGSSSSSSSSSSAPSSSSSTLAPQSDTTSGKSTAGAAASGTVKVTMKGLAYLPASITAKVGQTVSWVNDDSPPHNVTYVSGPNFASSSTMNAGAKFQIKLTQPGTIHYFCSIHPFMKATIAVTK